MKGRFVLAVLLFLAHSWDLAGSVEFTEVVETRNGPVRGVVRETLFGKVFSAFKGIRYGRPPVGRHRFKAPMPAEPWTEVYDAISSRNVCPQFDFVYENYTGDEDCLFLNVYTPTTRFDDTKSFPVAVYIYGGSFTQGYNKESVYGPDYLLENDVVVVIPNYRLGALGFLSTQSCGAPGNAGLKDQHLALTWVQKNIKSFGGNPRNVMLFGQSAGGVGVDMHVLAEKAKGLFQKTSTMSATALAPWATHSPGIAIARAFDLGKKLGFTTYDKNELIEFLREVDARDLVEATSNLTGILPFRVTIEELPDDCKDEAYITRCAIEQYESEDYHKLPHMMGYAKYETLFYAKPITNLLEWERMALSSVENSSEFSSPLKDTWEIVENEEYAVSIEAAYKLINFTSDVAFVAEIDLKHRLISKTNDHPIYYYILTYDSEYSLHRYFGVDLPGATHGDDFGYLFHHTIARLPEDLDDPYYKFCRRMARLWTNFAKYSNPTPDDGTDLGVVWPDSRESEKQLEINEELRVRNRQISTEAGLFESVLKPVIKIYTGCYNILKRVPKLLTEL